MNVINSERFSGLAFTVAKVRYTGNGYAATIERDGERFHARVSYDHAIGPGARNAVRAAVQAFEKVLTGNDGLRREGDYVAVPGDLNSDYYVFTFVPTRFIQPPAA